jgi:tetratricopeptide (TPR) repeat protein
MKQRLIKMIAMLVFVLFALKVGAVQTLAQQPTPTPGMPAPTPTPNLEGRICQLEAEQTQTVRSLELMNEQNKSIITVIGAFAAVLILIQTAATGFQAYISAVQLGREGKRDEVDSMGVRRVSDVMSVVQHTLQGRLDREREERERAQKAEIELENIRGQIGSLEQFHKAFQTIIRKTRREIDERASQWAKDVSRHDFRGMANDLNRFAQDFDSFKAGFEGLEEPRGRFTARVPYIRGIAAHYSNQPDIAKQYLEEVERRREELGPGDTERGRDRRVANAYYYLGLIESNFDNPQEAITLFNKANTLDPQARDFLTRVVTAEAYVMIGDFEKARESIAEIKKSAAEMENRGTLRNYHLRLQSRAILIEANMAILARQADWHQEAQELLEAVYEAEPHYYYATATLAQVYYDQGDHDKHDKARKLFGEAYKDMERSRHFHTVTEARSQILLEMFAGMCCKHRLMDDKLADEHLDRADRFRGRLPKIGTQVCTVFSPLSKKNEQNSIIYNHIELIRKGEVLL